MVTKNPTLNFKNKTHKTLSKSMYTQKIIFILLPTKRDKKNPEMGQKKHQILKICADY